MRRPLGAQISHMLRDRGVEVVFGIPGVHNVEMYRGIEEAGLRHVLARHEQGAGFMADGYARATGRPGVAYVITGPGVCNIMTPMGQAYSDSVPMLVISSCLDETAARKGQLHQMKDQAGAARTVCDWSEMAWSATAAYQLIDRALGEFAMARPRSKAITVPIGLLGAQADPAPVQATAVSRPAPDPAEVDRVAETLRAARRPMMILGGGAAKAGGAGWRVAEAFGAATFTTYAGRGLIPAGAPLHFGASLPRPGSADVIGQADVVLAVGSELSEVDLWRNHLGHEGRLIRVDIDESVFRDEHRAEDVVLADAAGFLSALADMPGGESDWDPAQVDEARRRWRAEADAERPGIVPVCDALRAALPNDVMVFSDMTQFAYTAKEIWPMPSPGLWHHPSGFGTLGYALPAAIGGKIGRGDAPVVCIAGDYGFQYTVQELGVAVELGLSLPIVLWDNGKLKEIEDCMVESQIEPNAVVARNPDFCALAEAYGAASARPQTLREMAEVVRAALDRAGPTLIHVQAGID